jgi:uncharacterized RDD family membrane protein YckC
LTRALKSLSFKFVISFVISFYFMETKFVYASFWQRFLALILDLILIGIVSSILSAIIPALSSIFRVLVGGGYYIYMNSSEYQATFGKMALGIKVTDLKGNRITPSVAAIRYVASIVSAAILLVGYIMAAFTEKKQALHDIIAGTLVLSTGITANVFNSDSEQTNASKSDPIEVIATTKEDEKKA